VERVSGIFTIQQPTAPRLSKPHRFPAPLRQPVRPLHAHTLQTHAADATSYACEVFVREWSVNGRHREKHRQTESRTSVWLSRRRATKGPSGCGFYECCTDLRFTLTAVCVLRWMGSGGKLPRFASGVESSKITTEKAFLYPACPFDHTIIMGGSS
jgi:hypothetical protein